MSWVAVAIGGSAAIGAGASIYGAGQAADAAAQGSKKAIGEQRRQFDTIMGLQQPYYQTGVGALNMMSALYGLPAQQPYSAANQPITVKGRGASQGSGLGRLDPAGRVVGEAIGLSHSIGLSGDKKEKFGATIDPITGTVTIPGDPERSAQMTAYLRTGEDSTSGKKLGWVRNAIGELRASGWKYDPNAAQAQAGQAAQPTQASVLEQFRNMPGYQFGMKEGTTAVEQGAAARSGVLGGNALRGVNAFSQDYAGTKLGEEWGRLATLAGYGTTAANTASNAAQQSANNIGQYYQNAGDARASGILGQYNGAANALNTGAQNWMLYKGGWFNAPSGR